MNVQTDPAFTDAPPNPTALFYFSMLKMGALGGIIATVAALWAQTNWAADLVAQLRVQWALGLFALVLLFAVARRWWWMLVCLIAFTVNAIPIWPYVYGYIVGPTTVGQQDVTSGSGELRLMSLNLLTKNRKWDEVVNSIQKASPDFVVLMEVDSVWRQVLKEGLGDEYPHAEFRSREDNFGIAFLSKKPWSQLEAFNSRALRLPSIDVTFTNVGDKPLRIIGTHPIPPMNQRNWDARNEQLINVVERFDSSTANVMVGDFNLSPWSPNFKKVVSAGNFNDASEAFGPTPTWYVFPTWLGGLKIDHALVSQDILVRKLNVDQDLGSDHRALIMDFEF